MRVSRTIAGVLLAAQTGCTTIHVVQAPSAELASGGPGRVYVTKNDGARVTIISPRVLDDTIFGFNASGQQYVLAVKDTKEIKARQLSMTRTGILGGAFFVGMIVATKVLLGKGAAPPVQEETQDAVVPLLRLLRLLR
jgi:hypothetical protein